MLDYAAMYRNRDQLIAWQNIYYNEPLKPGEVRLHLGSGLEHWPMYVNVDLFTEEADVKADIRDLSAWADNSVDRISCHHVLEHINKRDMFVALKEWHRVLKPGGLMDIGMPDVAIVFKFFEETDEFTRWTRAIDSIYGFPWEPGMAHQNGVSLPHLKYILKYMGFKIKEAYNYDANGAAMSLFILAEKLVEHATRFTPSVFEQDVVLGVYTHRDTYWPTLKASADRLFPDVQFITEVHDGTINQNWERLYQRFLQTDKRYWVYLDDDISFLGPDTIHNAVYNMVTNRWAACSIYSTFDPHWIDQGYRVERLVARRHRWATGYFVMVDRTLCGDILPDMNLPDGNTSVDTSYSCEILSRGLTIGISPDVCYHVRKEGSWVNQAVIEPTNNYLYEKWGRFYFDNIKYDGNVLEWPMNYFDPIPEEVEEVAE